MFQAVMNEDEKNARFQHFRKKKQEKLKEDESRPGLKVVKALPPLSNKPIIIASKSEVVSSASADPEESLELKSREEVERKQKEGEGENEMRPVITQRLQIKIKRNEEAERLAKCANEK